MDDLSSRLDDVESNAEDASTKINNVCDAVDPARYERAALRWLQRFIDERLPPLTEVAVDGAKRNPAKSGRLPRGEKVRT